MGKDLSLDAVIALREVNAINRIEDFVKACTLSGWNVSEIGDQN